MVGRFALVLSLAVLAGCAGKPQPNVKVRYTEIQPAPTPVPPPPVAAVPVKSEGDLPTLGAPLSTREAMDKAVAWAVEGITFYQTGKWDEARKSFSDARLILLEADLPEFWERQGLEAIRSGLPENLRHYDLEAVSRELERTNKLNPAELAERSAIETEVRRILRQFGDVSPEQAYLNVIVHETQQYVSFYRGKYREFFERSFLRKHKYWPTIQEVFASHKLPGELGYIAFVESGFQPKAMSHANAHGLWQFIPETGQRYGLIQKEDFYDVRKSTEAAAAYLVDLLNIFGARSFLLSTAAYNAGEGKIMNCLRRTDGYDMRSFWDIRSCLAVETQEYVPKIMAAAVISSDPKRFGFYLPSAEEMRKRYDVVVVPQVMSIARIAELSGVDMVDVRLANNDLDPNLSTTPGRNFPLYLPVGKGVQFSTALAALPIDQPQVMLASSSVPEIQIQEPERRPSERRTHVVKPGETLSSIARTYDVEVGTLAKANDIRSPYTLSIGQSLVLPGSTGDKSVTRVVYTVKSGNTLDEVAGIFSVRDQDILSWNSLRSRKIKSGQKLTLYPPRDYETRTYKVRRGDSLAGIARRFGVSIEHLLTVNGLTSKKILRPGQRLVLYVPA
ncbi:MAG TPA: LysM peptidoglycan-binding domain-containing protein [Thermoanaerobaculia bacterium]|jgi:membrane-bound lytic murein transglycosylase D|nr:LysM peptidoglycan-binding domain-containing protein [Thermoanaerobaculia bacterium]